MAAENKIPEKHCLVVIGYLGIKKAYLDIPKDVALARYKATEGEIGDECVKEFQFVDEFEAYDAWELITDGSK